MKKEDTGRFTAWMLAAACVLLLPSMSAYAVTGETETEDALKNEMRSRLDEMDVADPDAEVQRQFEVLKQMEEADPASEGDSLKESETQPFEFRGFDEKEETKETIPEETEPVFTVSDLSTSQITMEAGAYCYTVDGNDKIYMSIPDGASTEDPVEFAFSSDNLGIFSVKKDGVEDYNIFTRKFEDAGEYELQLYWINPNGTAEDMGMQIPVSFRIGTQVESEKRAIHPPTGFRFRSVSMDGREMTVPDRVLIPEKDGRYDLVFEAVKNPDITYSSTVTVDTTAPELKFSQEMTDKMRAPLSFELVEKDSTVQIFYNYRETVFENNILTRGGDYRIIVSDPAGNSRTYSFSLAEDNRKKIVITVAGAVIALAGILVYMRYVRDHMGVL